MNCGSAASLAFLLPRVAGTSGQQRDILGSDVAAIWPRVNRDATATCRNAGLGMR